MLTIKDAMLTLKELILALDNAKGHEKALKTLNTKKEAYNPKKRLARLHLIRGTCLYKYLQTHWLDYMCTIMQKIADSTSD